MRDAVAEAEIREFGKRWAEAELVSDGAQLRPMFADDFLGVGPYGFTLSREQWVDARGSGDLVHSSFTWEPADIRVYGDSAVVVGMQSQDSTYQGRPAPGGPFRVTQVLTRGQDGAWVLAGMHLCTIAAPPATS